MTKIVNLQIENVKRLKAVEITPAGEIVCIGGDNAQGKTSVLDSIEMALGGKSAIPEVPIRRGEKEARIVLQLDGPDSLTVERNFTPKGSYLTVLRGDGSKAGTPQALLDSLCSRIAFDPLVFLRAKPAEQIETLKKLVGLDFRTHDDERRKRYDHRTDVNRQLKQAEAAAAATAEVAGVPAEEISVSQLMDQLQQRGQVNQANAAARQALQGQRQRLQGLVDQAGQLEVEIEEVERVLARMKAELTNKRATIERGTAWIAAEDARVGQLVDLDLVEIQQQIASSQEVNARIRANQQRRQLLSEAAKLKAAADELTQQIEAIDAAKAHAMATAAWPIAGLGFSESGVTLAGLPLDQASSAEQLRVSVAIGFALNPKLPIVLIRDGSLLDANSLAAVARQAADRGGQVWIERVSKGSECQVIIEDGAIKA